MKISIILLALLIRFIPAWSQSSEFKELTAISNYSYYSYENGKNIISNYGIQLNVESNNNWSSNLKFQMLNSDQRKNNLATGFGIQKILKNKIIGFNAMVSDGNLLPIYQQFINVNQKITKEAWLEVGWSLQYKKSNQLVHAGKIQFNSKISNHLIQLGVNNTIEKESLFSPIVVLQLGKEYNLKHFLLVNGVIGIPGAESSDLIVSSSKARQIGAGLFYRYTLNNNWSIQSSIEYSSFKNNDDSSFNMIGLNIGLKMNILKNEVQ